MNIFLLLLQMSNPNNFNLFDNSLNITQRNHFKNTIVFTNYQKNMSKSYQVYIVRELQIYLNYTENLETY